MLEPWRLNIKCGGGGTEANFDWRVDLGWNTLGKVNESGYGEFHIDYS